MSVEESKKDTGLLPGCGGIVIAAVILMGIAIIANLVINGKKGIPGEDDIGQLRMGIIVLIAIGVIYLVKKGKG